MIMQEKNKSYKFRIRRIRFYSAKVTSIQKSPQITSEPMGIHHSPHTHTIPIPMGIPMGIPIPTAALIFREHILRRFDRASGCDTDRQTYGRLCHSLDRASASHAAMLTPRKMVWTFPRTTDVSIYKSKSQRSRFGSRSARRTAYNMSTLSRHIFFSFEGGLIGPFKGDLRCK